MSSGPRSSAHPLTRAYHGLWLVAATLTTSLGLIAGAGVLRPLDLVMYVLAAALTGAGCYWMLVHGIETRPVPLRGELLLIAALGTAVGAWALVGLTSLFGPPGCVALLLIAGLSPTVLRACARRIDRHLQNASTRTPMPLSLRTTPQLCDEWRTSMSALQSAPTITDSLNVVARRQELLGELERRHPAEVTTWLADATTGVDDIGRYLDQGRRND